MKSIAEDLKKSEEEATQIYNAVLSNIKGLKALMDKCQAMARERGYVEDKWGRRRYIPDMQLEPYVLTSKGTNNFDPFFDSAELGVVDDIERTKADFIDQLLNARYRKQKDKIKERAKEAGFEVTENTKKIEDATRQCVNSAVQGSAASQSKIAIRLVGTNPRLKELGFHMELLVHDEILGEVPYVNAYEAIPIFTQCMLNSAKDLRTGARCDASIVQRWYGEEIDYEDLLNPETLAKIKAKLYH